MEGYFKAAVIKAFTDQNYIQLLTTEMRNSIRSHQGGKIYNSEHTTIINTVTSDDLHDEPEQNPGQGLQEADQPSTTPEDLTSMDTATRACTSPEEKVGTWEEDLKGASLAKKTKTPETTKMKRLISSTDVNIPETVNFQLFWPKIHNNPRKWNIPHNHHAVWDPGLLIMLVN